MLVKLQAKCQHFKKEPNLVSFKDFAYLKRAISRTTSITKKFDLYLYCMSQPCMTCYNCTPLVQMHTLECG